MLNPEAYRQLIQVHGERFRWLKAVPSDQYNPATGLDQSRSDTLSDHGHVYLDQGVYTGLVTQQKRDMLHPDLGWIYAGQLWLTVMPGEARLAPFDKVVLLDRTQVARVRLVRGQQLTGQDAPDQLGHPYPVRVTLVADSSGVYTENVHWRFDPASRAIVWLSGGPAEGATYSVEYLYNPVYWFLGSDFREPRPLFGSEDVVTPLKGLLSLKPPEA